jgi:cell division septation protein DedD
VIVRINDKISNSQYALYLSKAAAEELECEGRIATDVKMEVVPKPATDFGFNQVITPTAKDPLSTPAPPQPMVGPAITKQDDAVLPDPATPTSKAVTPPPATLKDTFWKVGTYNMDGSAVKPLGYGVQVGSFSTIEDALEEGRKFQNLQFGNVYVQSGWDKGAKSFRVLIGSFMKEEDTKDVIDFLNMRKYNAFPRKHLM